MEKKEASKWYNSFRTIPSFRNISQSSLRRQNNEYLFRFDSALSGFTLIELVIVVAIAAILVTVFLLVGNPSVQTARAKDSQRISDLRQLKSALDLYYDDHKCYPDAIPTDSWVENGVVYMVKVPKDPDIGTTANLGYIYQVDKSSNCPQWNVLYTIFTSRQFKQEDCPLSAMSTCNYSGKMACSISGEVDCNYISNNPVNPANAGGLCPVNSPKKYIKDQNGNCNVAPNDQGTFCIEQCGQ
jgi:prepilin-type N-terminal cleavage/methylation domain-containing protein